MNCLENLFQTVKKKLLGTSGFQTNSDKSNEISNYQEVNERRKKEGKSYVGYYRPKSAFIRQRIQEHLERVNPESAKRLKDDLTP